MVEETVESLTAFLLQSTTRRPSRLTLTGYIAVQEASYWALALAPGLDLWGVDRQLRDADFRQRVFFAQRLAEAQPHKFVLVAPDPALAYGEPYEPGMKILEACHFSLASDKLLYLTGDAHHYERRAVGDSMHVIAGGGGAFVHGTRIPRDSNGASPQCVYPDRRTSLRLALGMPLRLALGTAGFLPHGVFALLAVIEIIAFRVRESYPGRIPARVDTHRPRASAGIRRARPSGLPPLRPSLRTPRRQSRGVRYRQG